MSSTEYTTAKNMTDGATMKVDEKMLADLKAKLENVDQYVSTLKSTRLDGANTRLAIWSGQTKDGRKHAEANNEEDVRPFEGACDQRVRLADMLVNDEVMLLVLASLDSQKQITPVEGTDVQKSANMKVLLRYIINNKLGWRWMKELIKSANYYLADSPALVWIDVRWNVEEYLTPVDLTTEQLGQQYVATAVNLANSEDGDEQMRVAQAAFEQFVTLLQTPSAGDQELAEYLVSLFPEDIELTRANKMVKELRKDGVAHFAAVARNEGVAIEGKRLWEDFYIPSTATEFQTSPCVFETEWLTLAELEGAEEARGWDAEFVTQMRAQDGKKAIDSEIPDEDTRGNGRDEKDYSGLYQVVNAMFISVNKRGIPGRYEVTFNPYVTVTAADAELMGTVDGKYPGHILQREVLSKFLMDSRSIPELSTSDQDSLKLFMDSWGDNAQISAVPPIVTRGRRSMGRLYIEPLMELQAKRDGDYKWLAPPAYPASVVRIMDQIKDFQAEYHGRPNAGGTNDILVGLARQFKVTWWLAQLGEILKQILQVAQRYMPEEELARITNTQGEALIKSREDIAGMFDISISYDARDLNVDDFMKRAKAIKDVLMVMDREGVINSTPIVTDFLHRLEPTLAETSIRTKAQAAESELDDEMDKYQQALAGIEPQMVTDGSQNYALRLSFYTQIREANPAIYASLTPDRMEIIQARIEHLAAMAEQFGANAAIGRQGTPGALSANAEQPIAGGDEA